MIKTSIFRRCTRALLLLWASWAAFVFPVLADDPAPKVRLSISGATPREVEDTTEKAIVRDYSAAWAALTKALAGNRAGALEAGFTGAAHDELAARIEQQAKNGVRTQITDRGHNLEAVIYTPEGSAMQLHDTAQLDIQVLDGGNVIHSEHATVHYVVLMTVAEDRWKVRLLQAVPGF